MTPAEPVAVWTVTCRDVQLLKDPTQDPATTIIGLEPTLSGIDNGMEWTVTMTVPSGPRQSSAGQVGFLQLWTPDRALTVGGSNVPISGRTNNVNGLDGTFPMYGSAYSPYEEIFSGDSPLMAMGDSELAQFQAAGVSLVLSASDTFTTYLMYQPGGSGYGGAGTIWVPLLHYSWYYDVDNATWSNGDWVWSGTPASPQSFTPKPVGSEPVW